MTLRELRGAGMLEVPNGESIPVQAYVTFSSRGGFLSGSGTITSDHDLFSIAATNNGFVLSCNGKRIPVEIDHAEVGGPAHIVTTGAPL